MTFWAVGAAAAGAIGGAVISGKAAKSAANTQAQSASDATAAQERMFGTQVALQEPWRQAGIAGLGKLNSLLGLTPAPSATLVQGADGSFSPAPAGFDERAYLAANPDVAQYIAAHPGETSALQHYQTFGIAEGRQLGTPATAAGAPGAPATPTGAADPEFGSLMHDFSAADFQADPGYAFRLSEGQKAIDRAASAGPGFQSGKYLKDLTTFNQGQAAQEFGNAYNRYQTNRGTKLNALQTLAGVGQSSANTLTGAASTLGGQIGSNIIGAGNAAAAGQVGTANAINGAIGQGLSMYQTNQLLSRFPAYGGYSGGVTPPNPYYTG